MLNLKIEDLEVLYDLLANVEKVVILTHTGLDPDAQGSALALYYILKQNFKDLDVTPLFFEELIPIRIKQLPEVYKDRENDAGKLLKNADLILIVDTSDLHRAVPSALVETLKNSLDKIVIVDHHATPAKLAKKARLVFKLPQSSCAQMVYYIFCKHLKLNIDWKAAYMLLWGILGDTRGLRYLSNKEGYVLEFIKELMEFLGSKITLRVILEDLEIKIPLESLDLYKKIINTLRVDGSGAGVYMPAEAKEYDLKLYVLHYFLELLEGIQVFFTLTKDDEEKGGYYVSLRSRGDYNVAKVAEYFGGGGHKNAAGAKLKARNYKQAMNAVFKKIKEIIPGVVES